MYTILKLMGYYHFNRFQGESIAECNFHYIYIFFEF